MPKDFKKEYRQFYIPHKAPYILNIPPMNYIAVKGRGDTEEAGGEFDKARTIVTYLVKLIKAAPKNGLVYDGWYDFVIPPDEILFYNRTARRENLEWRFMIRVPEFFSLRDFPSLIAYAAEKKDYAFDKAEFITHNEGFAVQMMHTGASTSIRKTITELTDYAIKYGYKCDISKTPVHEIYLTDPARTTDVKKAQRAVRIQVSF